MEIPKRGLQSEQGHMSSLRYWMGVECNPESIKSAADDTHTTIQYCLREALFTLSVFRTNKQHTVCLLYVRVHNGQLYVHPAQDVSVVSCLLRGCIERVMQADAQPGRKL